MTLTRFAALFSATLLAAVSLAPGSAKADAFSMQSFSGETATMNDLPGVRFDPLAGGPDLPQNCTERTVGYQEYGRHSTGGTVRECQVGNFTFSTTGSPSALGGTRYHGMPAPGAYYYGGRRP